MKIILSPLPHSNYRKFFMRMSFLWCLIIVLYTVRVLAIKTPPEQDYYHAAVLEYMPINGSGPEDTLFKNVEHYVEIIAEAAKKADIVVFPEGGLNNRDLTLFTKIPYEENKATYIDGSVSTNSVIKKLSKAAKDNNVYLTINIHEEKVKNNITLKYNTNVVFDRNGSIIARYRKYNLFSTEEILDTTSEPEHAYFDTDFGVRFGTFICFDILFEEPSLILVQKYNVSDIIFTTWWFSELPFLTAVQEQAAWSYATNTNLLASGINALSLGSTGSGIYAGNRGPVVSLLSLQTGTRLLTAKIYKKGRAGISAGDITDFPPTTVGNENLIMKKEYLEDYITLLLKPDTNDASLKKVYYSGEEGKYYFIQNFIIERDICQSKFCCQFQINMTVTYKTNDFPINEEKSFHLEDSFYHFRYRLAVFNGIRSFSQITTGGSQVCGIIPCLNDTFESCGMKTGKTVPLVIDTHTYGPLYLYSTVFHKITIKTSSTASHSYTFPQFLESSNKEEQFGSVDNISNINFFVNGSSSTLSFASSKLVSTAIYVRVYSRDGEQGVIPSLCCSHSLSALLFYISLLLFLPKLFH